MVASAKVNLSEGGRDGYAWESIKRLASYILDWIRWNFWFIATRHPVGYTRPSASSRRLKDSSRLWSTRKLMPDVEHGKVATEILLPRDSEARQGVRLFCSEKDGPVGVWYVLWYRNGSCRHQWINHFENNCLSLFRLFYLYFPNWSELDQTLLYLPIIPRYYMS